jgi:hypothetical protein
MKVRKQRPKSGMGAREPGLARPHSEHVLDSGSLSS